MPAYSDSDIMAAMASGEISISPFAESSLSASGYDLRSAAVATIQPGGSALIHTLERVELPPSVCAQMFIRSSFAREGLVGSFALVDPGFRGQLTLRIANLGAAPVRIGEGERVAQLVFHRLVSPSRRPYAGRYQDSSGTVGSRRDFASGV
jgi:dCTP deaminase